jgi:hypothetical protein
MESEAGHAREVAGENKGKRGSVARFLSKAKGGWVSYLMQARGSNGKRENFTYLTFVFRSKQGIVVPFLVKPERGERVPGRRGSKRKQDYQLPLRLLFSKTELAKD